MTRAEKRAISFIININPYIYELSDKIESEQDRAIHDTFSTAKRVVERIIELDNRRIDLCNLKVLYGFIERGLAEKFSLLLTVVKSGGDSELFSLAASECEKAGYDSARILDEFRYLIEAFKPKRKKRLSAARSSGISGFKSIF